MASLSSVKLRYFLQCKFYIHAAYWYLRILIFHWILWWRLRWGLRGTLFVVVLSPKKRQVSTQPFEDIDTVSDIISYSALTYGNNIKALELMRRRKKWPNLKWQCHQRGLRVGSHREVLPLATQWLRGKSTLTQPAAAFSPDYHHVERWKARNESHTRNCWIFRSEVIFSSES